MRSFVNGKKSICLSLSMLKWILLDLNSNFSFGIYNISGKLCLEGENLKTINISSLDSGTYILRIEVEIPSQVGVQKFIIIN